MTSSALATWRSSRLDRIDRLLAAHPDSAGSTTGPAAADELTEALVVRLASEFQGFCRDLHDDAIEAVIKSLPVRSSAMYSMLMEGLISGRGLDRRSADPKTVGDDFDRLGLSLWGALAMSRPASVAAWREALVLLHRARNGVAHADHRALAAVQAAGWPVRLETVRRWRKLLDEIAEALDDAFIMEIDDLIGKNHS